jgi:hypothetical protein
MNKINDVMNVVTENDEYWTQSWSEEVITIWHPPYKERFRETKLQATQLLLDAFFRKKAGNYTENDPQLGSFSII